MDDDEGGRTELLETAGRKRAESEEASIDRACYHFMNDPALAPLRAWWEAMTERVMLPPGPPDTGRLLMVQGDRERRLAILDRASRHRRRMSKGTN